MKLSNSAPGVRHFAPKASVRVALLLLPLAVSACAPTAITVISLAAGGFSYAATGKSVSDHALSSVTQSDCAVHRVLMGDPVCEDILLAGGASPAVRDPAPQDFQISVAAGP